MATTIYTGRSITLTIETKDYSDQILSSVLTVESERLTFDTLAGRAFKYLDKNATLDIEWLDDWSETDSLSKALWTAMEADPDATLTCVMTVNTGDTFTFEALPNWPSAGGSGADAQQQTTSLQVVGTITEAL